MSWMAIAKKDFRDARRAKILWGATAVFVFFYALFLFGASRGNTEAADAVGNLIGVGAFFMPLAIIAMGYLAVTGERESGSIKYLLGLPNSRGEVLLGKFLGRSAVALVAVGIAVLAGAVLFLVLFQTIPVEYLSYTLLTMYFAVVFIAISVGFSAIVSTRGKAMASTIGLYFVFGVIWLLPATNPINAFEFVVEDLLGMGAMPKLYQFLRNLSPMWAYGGATDALIFGVEDGGGPTGRYDPAAADTPFYLSDVFLLLVLAAWIVVPLALGYWRFNRAELG